MIPALGLVYLTTHYGLNSIAAMQLRLRAIPSDPAVRNLALTTLINTLGNGLFMTIDVIYFTTIVGLSPAHVALGLTIAGGVGVLANIPAGSDPLSFLALKDRRYVAATLLNAVMSLHFILQTVAIPLWIVRETHAPRWWVSVVMLVNTLGVIALTASLLLILAMFIHVYGEILGSIGSWNLGFGLAQEKHQGQYQGIWSLGIGLSSTFGPAIVIFFAITLGRVGWLYLAAIFLITGMAMNHLVRTDAQERSPDLI